MFESRVRGGPERATRQISCSIIHKRHCLKKITLLLLFLTFSELVDNPRVFAGGRILHIQIPPDWGMLRRSRCVLIFLLKHSNTRDCQFRTYIRGVLDRKI